MDSEDQINMDAMGSSDDSIEEQEASIQPRKRRMKHGIQICGALDQLLCIVIIVIYIHFPINVRETESLNLG